jgi:hypothetical protein
MTVNSNITRITLKSRNTTIPQTIKELSNDFDFCDVGAEAEETVGYRVHNRQQS